jgi:hypothetical protein
MAAGRYPLNYGTILFCKSITNSPVLQLNRKIYLKSCNNALMIFDKDFLISQLILEEGRRKKEEGRKKKEDGRRRTKD